MLYLSILFIISGILLFVYSIISDSEESEQKKFIIKKAKVKDSPQNNAKENTIEIKDEPEPDKGIVPRYLYSDESNASFDSDGEEDRFAFDSAGKSNHSDSEPDDDFFFFDDDTETAELSEEAFNKLKQDIESDDNINPDSEDAVSSETGHTDEDTESDSDSGNESITESPEFTLYNDTSSLIDYRTDSGNIDPTIQRYKNISRVGKGTLVLDREGINFYTKNKHFRFDFYKIHELFPGNNYLAFFTKGNDTAKLFVTDKDTDIISKIENSYREFIDSQS